MMDVVALRRIVWLQFLFVVMMTGPRAWADSNDLPTAQEPAAVIEPCPVLEGRSALLVRVDGIQNAVGNLRVNLYGANPDDFLVKGKKLYRIELPARTGAMVVCLPLPGAGTYALVAFHDRNANGKVNITKDGFGFSNNPKMRLRRPKHKEVAFVAGPGRTEVDIHLRYIFRYKGKSRAHVSN